MDGTSKQERPRSWRTLEIVFQTSDFPQRAKGSFLRSLNISLALATYLKLYPCLNIREDVFWNMLDLFGNLPMSKIANGQMDLRRNKIFALG